MTKIRNIKERAAKGIVSYGLNIGIRDSVVIEIAARAGYDFVRVDCEHMLFDNNTIVDMVRTARLLELPIQIRVPTLTNVTSLLDLGVCGVMVPHTNCRAVAQEAVMAVKYAPLGNRGMSGSARVLNYGETKLQDYAKTANDYVSLIVQIEDKLGLENIDDILSVPGIDMVATGKNDLAQALGIPGENNHPEVIAAEDYVIRKAIEHGKYPTLMARTEKRIAELKAKGVFCFTLERDEKLLYTAAQEKLVELSGKILD